MKEYCKNEICISDIQPIIQNKKRVVVILEEKDVMKYVDIEIDKPRYLLTLANLVKYPVRNYCAKLFENSHMELERDELIKLYRENWLYFACTCPLWRKRVRKYGGTMDHETEKIVFKDDDREDEFHAKYYYDTDEQPAFVMDLHLGKETQWTWSDFYDCYCK